MNVTNSSQEDAHQQQHHQYVNHNIIGSSSENDEEPVVTSTSNDLSLSSPAHIQQLHQPIDTTITSPARITSSTGNDCSVSPPMRQQHNHYQQQQLQTSQQQQQQHQQQQQQQSSPTQTQRQFKIDLTADGSSEDDSRSRQEFDNLILEQQQRLQQEQAQQQHIDTIDVSDVVVMPTTSTSIFKTNSSASSIKNKKLSAASASTSSAFGTDMVARDLLAPAVADSGGGNSSISQHNPDNAGNIHGSSGSSSNESHKIILKLPRNLTTSAPITESQMEVDHATSNSSSNSSSCAEETRKVEPLKINLLHSHSQNVVPKITIKPILKKQPGDASEDDDAARPNIPIPKLTIKSTGTTGTAISAESNCSQLTNSTHEPHIVPKLTIRSAGDESGSAHSSVVPKLTIKMSDPQFHNASSGNSSLLSPVVGGAIVGPTNAPTAKSSSILLTGSVPSPPPPLPKLTIKTSLDGTSESIISTISPASLSSSSTSSSSSSSNASLQSPATGTSIPKLTIKPIQKPEELVPKLTIKTNASGTTSAITSAGGETTECTTEDTSSSKIPKLTIKTGQEHAVIITQHNDATNSQSIPKLTIKTKSLDAADTGAGSQDLLSDSNRDEPPPEKIPKITIKANDTPTAEVPKFTIKPQICETDGPPPIPKLTISVSNVETSSGPQSPLVVRQLTASLSKPESPERVPKLMISRQDTTTSASSMLVVSNHVDASEKTVPKLTIKTSSLEAAESKEKATKFSIKCSPNIQEEEKIPKITIKPLMTVQRTQSQPQQSQSSEESDECVSLSSCSSPVTVQTEDQTAATTNKLVPKLTIKNLCSPKPMIKTTTTSSTSSTTDTASKKSVKNDAVAVATDYVADDVEAKNDTVATPKENNEKLPAVAVVVMNAEETVDEGFATMTTVNETVTTNGESSSSQEFCGFNDNTTDSTPNIEEETGAAAEILVNNPSNTEKPRRPSDDMDIDEALQEQHDPQVFNNVTHLISSNGESSRNVEIVESMIAGDFMSMPPTNLQLSHVIDTVDLTSSPSPGSSPAYFNYADTEPLELEAQPSPLATKTNELLEHLQHKRETSVIQKTTSSLAQANSILLNQLTNKQASVAARSEESLEGDTALQSIAPPPPLQPKPALVNCIMSSNSTRYPQLTERLLANGIHTPIASNFATISCIPPNMKATMPQKVIDSIEILDTPEGSPRSSLDEEPAQLIAENHKLQNHLNEDKEPPSSPRQKGDNKERLTRNNNNLMRANHINLKRHLQVTSPILIGVASKLEQESLQISPNKIPRIENDSNTMATITILTNDHQDPTTTVVTTSPTIVKTNNHCTEAVGKEATQHHTPPQHRSRKQKHDHLLSVPIEEEDPLKFNSNDATSLDSPLTRPTTTTLEKVTKPAAAAESVTPVNVRKRGRPRKNVNNSDGTPQTAPAKSNQTTDNEKQEIGGGDGENKAVKSRLSRVQMLRKRLAIDMVATEQPPPIVEDLLVGQDDVDVRPDTPRRDRNLRGPIRTSRRSATPNMFQMEKALPSPAAEVRKTPNNNSNRKKPTSVLINDSSATTAVVNHQQHFGGSNSSISSACSTSSLSSATTSAAVTMAAQIDLTMSSSSSSNGCSNTITTVEAGGHQQKNVNSMLPPTTILSSSDPLADVIFKPNDFSSLAAAEQLRSPTSKSRHTSLEDVNIMLTPTALSRKDSRTDSQDDTGGSGADNSGEDSASSSSATTPGRGRGRGRGRSRGTSNVRGHRAHRLGRGASVVAKQIAMSRPRCVGGLKHTPDPDRIKGLFNPGPQVFEEDTRMSADLSQQEPTQSTPIIGRQLDFLNNEESQSSIVSNTSILDPNTVAAVQNGAQMQKRPKKKKMEVCVQEDVDFSVASIAEYDWPPPKGCCPSKNRDTFMIQEQVANYLGIKSFKRKYPDLPRRQIDMEERNWLQEKSLVSEKMCDLGITAVWASDVLDIMYTDFYDKYEEYKDFIRQKHLREIEAKQKALGLNVNGRGLQARDRAMLSTSKWNAYFNRTRKEERTSCLDLQTLTMNMPVPCNAIASAIINRPSLVPSVIAAVKAEGIVDLPSTMLKLNLDATPTKIDKFYPLALVPGQFCEKYRHYTPRELRSHPVNTVLDHPFAKKTRTCLDSETDTESAAETNVDGPPRQKNDPQPSTTGKRIPIRRSRRARTHATNVAAAERAKINCDIKFEKEKLEHKSDDSNSSEDEFSSTSSSSSGSSTSSSETDSDSESSRSSADEESPAKCGVCHLTQNKNLKDLPELFIKCYTCRRRVHPSCIEMPHRMVARVRNYNWQCADCKCCIKCKRKQDQNKMLFCEQCDRGFHIYCLNVKSVPDGRWSCDRCSICMRCGATKPEGLPQNQNILISPPYPGAPPQVKQIKHKKVKWINEYRIDHITKLREHCSMLCVPCGRAKTTINRRNNHSSGGCGVVGGQTNGIHSPQIQHSQMSPPPAPGAATTTNMNVTNA